MTREYRPGEYILAASRKILTQMFLPTSCGYKRADQRVKGVGQRGHLIERPIDSESKAGYKRDRRKGRTRYARAGRDRVKVVDRFLTLVAPEDRRKHDSSS